MNCTSSMRRQARAFAVAGLLISCAGAVHADDTFSAGQLSIPSLSNGPVTYSNVKVTVGSIASGPAGTSPVGSVDTLDTSTGRISIPTVHVGAGTFYNAAITVGSLASIGGVTGADSYNGTNLILHYVQVGGTFYRNVVVGVGSVVRVAGGMPAGAWDTYNGGNGELTIPAVQVGAAIYTNVTIKVGKVVSVGGGPGTAQTITYTAPNAASIPVGSSTAISATTNGSLPVTFVVATPQTCAVVANSSQLQNFYFSYSGSGYSGSGVLTGVAVGTNIYEIDAVAGTAAGQPLGMLPTTTPANVTVGSIPYPIFAASGLALDNIFYANGGPLVDQAGIGLQVPGNVFNLYYFAGAGYLYVDLALESQQPPYVPIAMSAAEVSGLVGLANGTCNVVAFQNGNYYMGYGYASATPVLLSVPVGTIILP
jgi:hypothetical protein